MWKCNQIKELDSKEKQGVRNQKENPQSVTREQTFSVLYLTVIMRNQTENLFSRLLVAEIDLLINT